MNYPYPSSSPYIQMTMSHALQAMMSGTPLPPNCVIMAMPIQQAQQILPQLMLNSSYYGQKTYKKNPHSQPTQPKVNYPIVSYKKLKKKIIQPTPVIQPHSNIYNSSSFDSYMHNLSWSRLFDHPSRKPMKQHTPIETSKPPRLNSSSSASSTSSSSSSTTSDETIRRVDVTNKPSANFDPNKLLIKGSLPFKYSSEYIPGIGKQQQQQSKKIKSHDVYFIKK